ncbi:hypothetical protein ACMU6081_19820 [Achromobacter mucicolens]|uniref:Uncharacterized protein n=1 Tax=Achromobacter mucicolens TaxID=1389922 RepID=A0ABM8L7S2_9BURK|nr:hypothetical protein LMG3415_00580 [Achromobacter mucicolens]
MEYGGFDVGEHVIFFLRNVVYVEQRTSAQQYVLD